MSRSYALAATVAALVLVPAGSALADETDPMNGMGCIHASGEGPDSLAAAAPADGAGSTRAPSEQPIAPAAGSSAPAKPTAPASKPVSQVTKPALQQVSKPATQVPVQRPATTTARAGTTATATATAAGEVTAATRVRVQQARAKRVVQRARKHHERVFERRFNGLEPKVAPLSANVEKPVLEAKPARPAERTPTGVLIVALMAMAGLVGIAAIARRRRGSGGVTASPAPVAPVSYDAVEAELHEIIAEERARELLSGEPTEVH